MDVDLQNMSVLVACENKCSMSCFAQELHKDSTPHLVLQHMVNTWIPAAHVSHQFEKNRVS